MGDFTNPDSTPGAPVDPQDILNLAPRETPEEPKIRRKPRADPNGHAGPDLFNGNGAVRDDEAVAGSSGGSKLGDLDPPFSFPHSRENYRLLRIALPYIPVDDRDNWLHVGMALHYLDESWQDLPRKMWDAWSKKSSKFNKDNDQDTTWNHFRPDHKNPITVETVWRLAEEHGWVDPRGLRRPVTLEDFLAYMPTHTCIFIPTRELWPVESVNARLPKIGKTLPAKWLFKNACIEQMTWAPGKPAIIRNQLVLEGGWEERHGVSVFNLYRPPPAICGNPRAVQPWIELTFKVFCEEDANHLIKWCAHKVQHPEVKINHALILGGAPGIGKDTMLEPIKHAIGHWNFKEVSPKQVMGRFNSCLKSIILRINEGRDLGDVDRYQFYDHLKDYIAAPPDVLRVDEKHLREYVIANCTGIIITTNHKTGGLYLPPEDRRHYVAWSGLARTDFEEGYWTKIYDWYARGGGDNVTAYLRELDISKFDPKASPHERRRGMAWLIQTGPGRTRS